MRAAVKGAGRGAAARKAAVRRSAVRSTRRANRALAGFVVAVGLFLLVASRVLVNASWSDDAWGNLLLPLGSPQRGDVVIFDPPDALGATAPYLKTVRGLPGAVVGVDEKRWVSLDGERVGRAKAFALDGWPLVTITPARIPPGHYYLHADHPDSHDSRYAEIGLVPRERILGRAVALPEEGCQRLGNGTTLSVSPVGLVLMRISWGSPSPAALLEQSCNSYSVSGFRSTKEKCVRGVSNPKLQASVPASRMRTT